MRNYILNFSSINTLASNLYKISKNINKLRLINYPNPKLIINIKEPIKLEGYVIFTKNKYFSGKFESSKLETSHLKINYHTNTTIYQIDEKCNYSQIDTQDENIELDYHLNISKIIDCDYCPSRKEIISIAKINFKLEYFDEDKETGKNLWYLLSEDKQKLLSDISEQIISNKNKIELENN